MYRSGFLDPDAMDGILSGAIRYGAPTRRFDEYYRCYPVAMLPGPVRENVNHGGKVIMPPSALDKLTRLHITYPMLFELHNGAKERMTHAGVLEFIAEEGKIYLPFWLMQTLLLEPGDLIQVKSTDLPPGRFIKLQPQSTSFLDISDPKAVLENAFRNFSCLTKGDVFTFAYNDQIYEIAVLDVKPDGDKKAISVLETDLEVDFAPPVGYEEPTRTSGTSTPRSGQIPALHGGLVHSHGSMAQAINYAAIAPESSDVTKGAKAVSSNFLSGGHRLNAKKSSKTPTPQPNTPVAGSSTNPKHPPPTRKTNGPQPLRLGPNKLFFGYAIKPVPKRDEEGKIITEADDKPKFQGQGQTLRARKKGTGGDSATPTSGSDVEGRKR
ncbi:ubiquitin fusion degradation protein Ufd1, putative [Talaromyces stipitatus ATCC 10500]|uniref:Ubiquitin fusion degradation protein 1 n=1 Tax=Talaromyces stipitatus (strain ATCC 10500 / CBS 375.48 / QM 6759 / NRRL 1006) TaxID=441959 RepID=B8MJE6_TALSN|nr:ubiquitin fusion degradation protein Ufd1, putative [Talaromyces stipitatus ATCC 10500]EED15146.1 ubiquitin fusion degradation protein Ufd1, putative [Talaromyces stipitatus ATCC 10500]